MKLIFCLRVMLLSCLLSVLFLGCGTDDEQSVTADPIFSLSSGTYAEGTAVVLSSTSPGAVIYYSTNGGVPNAATSPVYNGSLVLMTNTTLQAMAKVTGWLPSVVVSNNYIITKTVASPTLLPAAGTYTQVTNLIFNCLTTGATFEYSTNGGSDWHAGANLFIDRSTTVLLRGKKNGYTNSAIVSAQYILQVQQAIFSKSNSSFLSPFNLELSCSTLGAIIYYSTNGGSSWIAGSTLAISNSCAVQVKAQKAGWQDSQVVEQNYKIKQYGWARTSTAAEFANPLASCVDNSDNLYVVGDFMQSVDFDFGPGVDIQAAGSGACFIVKYNSAGEYCWSRKLTMNVKAVCADKKGNIYLTGQFNWTNDFDPGVGVDERISNGGHDIFITQFKNDGTYGWTRTIGGTELDYGIAVACTPNGDLLLAGRYSGIVDFDPGVGQTFLTNQQGAAAFLSRYNSVGTHLWTRSTTVSGTSGISSPDCKTLVADDQGNIYLGGTFSGTVDFHWSFSSDMRTAVDSHDIWISRFNSAGQIQWTKTIGGTSIDLLTSLAVDQDGNLYGAGSFVGNIDFDPGAASVIRNSVGLNDMFVLKWTAEGNFCWVRTFGGSENERVLTLLEDGNGTLYMGGYFHGTVDFDPAASVDNRSAIEGDGFLLSLSSSGEYRGVITLAGNGFSRVCSINLAKDGSLFATGHFQYSVDFNFGSDIDSRTAVGPYDMFIMKIMP